MRLVLCAAGVLALLVAACPKAEDTAVARGRRAYMGTCITCHNADPALDGPVGPAVKGASKALLEARLLHAAYPSGYRPKRETHTMPVLPQVAGSIDDLAAFLSQP